MKSMIYATPIAVLAASFLQIVTGEIRKFDLILQPTSKSVHFADGFLITPGLVDLRQLKFTALEEKIHTDLDDEVMTETDDEAEQANVGGGGTRQLSDGFSDRGNSLVGSSVDIAVFHLPQECATSRSGCDWPELGIGKRLNETVRYCCSNTAISEGLCESNQYGRLIMDATKFPGQHRFLNIPSTGTYDNYMKSGGFKQKSGNGKYVVAMANCNDEGRPVKASGRIVWESDHGYLPGDLFGLMYFFAIVTALYFVLLLCYGIAMRVNEDENIPIQKWILVTVAMGTLEMFFRSGDLFVWNEDGSRFWFAFYVGIVMGILKRGVSRGLIVMVALGWGVIRDDLGPVMRKIKALVGFYIVVSFVREFLNIMEAFEVQHISEEEDSEIVDVVDILTVVIAFIEVLFYLWIIDALNETMEYLENMSQSLKLLRYLRLRAILLFSILFAVMWAVFAIVDSRDEGIVSQESKWVLDASMELNYLFVLAGVAYLWKPSPDAKSYAFVMELPTTGGGADDDDDEDDTNFPPVPSALDDDDEDENGGDTGGGDDALNDNSQPAFKDEPYDEATTESKA